MDRYLNVDLFSTNSYLTGLLYDPLCLSSVMNNNDTQTYNIMK